VRERHEEREKIDREIERESEKGRMRDRE